MTSVQPQTPPPHGREKTGSAADGAAESRESQSSADAINDGAFAQNVNISIVNPPSTPFKTRTIAPSPSPDNLDTANNRNLLAINTSPSAADHVDALGIHVSPMSAGLRVRTDIPPNTTATVEKDSNRAEEHPAGSAKQAGSKITRTPSVREALLNRVNSNVSLTESALSSPMLNALTDVTPLPSPLLSGDSPGPWRRIGSRPQSRETSMPLQSTDAALVNAANGESISSTVVNQSKRKAYHGLIDAARNGTALHYVQAQEKNDEDGHSRNRSVSEYIPEPVQVPKPRHQAVSGSHAPLGDSTTDASGEPHMRREPHLAVKRGITKPPTPPSSRAGDGSDSESALENALRKLPTPDYFDAVTVSDGKKRRWRAVKRVGQGTFSNVILATSQPLVEEVRNRLSGQQGAFVNDGASHRELAYDLKSLVAVKIILHGPRGGASEERVEMSLKRELELMKSVHHPCLVHLKAFAIEETRALLILTYCPGGDLFDLASEHRELLVPSLLQRIVSELVGAIYYLHERHIVHRDIKLENVLVNLPQNELAQPIDWSMYPYSVVTLTDLGLSRTVTEDEKLTTRCGSDDYAAPEVIMGTPYDGRAVDAWSLGVLVYALLEFRLPFDPMPGVIEGIRQRSKTTHRIARIEWRWVVYAGDDGDHEADLAKFEKAGLTGAMNVVEHLLQRARSRWTIEETAQDQWVKDGVKVEGGIKFREEEYPEEVSTEY